LKRVNEMAFSKAKKVLVIILIIVPVICTTAFIGMKAFIKANTYFVLGNGKISLKFSDKCFALREVTDEINHRKIESSFSFVWKLVVVRTGKNGEKEFLTLTSSDSLWKRTRFIKNTDFEKELKLVWLNKKYGKITVTVDLPNESSMSYWKISTENYSKEYSIWYLDFPYFHVEPINGEKDKNTLALPVYGGVLIRNPFDNIHWSVSSEEEVKSDLWKGNWDKMGSYPGSYSAQFAALYDDSGEGLYIASYDGEMYSKRFLFDGKGDVLNVCIRNYPRRMLTPGIDYNVPYEFVVGIFHGDWMDAAEIYKDWAKKQIWCEKGPMYQWEDLSKAVYDTDLSTIEAYRTTFNAPAHYSQVKNDLLAMKEFFDKYASVEESIPKIGIHWIGWSKYLDVVNANSGVPNYLPPQKNFAELIKEIDKTNAFYNDVYFTLLGADMNTPYKSDDKYKWEDYKEFACYNPAGKPYRRFGPHLCWMDPSQKEWQDMEIAVSKNTYETCNLDGIYYDWYPQFRLDFKHHEGGGNYFAEGYREEMQRIKKEIRKINPHFYCYPEGKSEIEIGVFDAMPMEWFKSDEKGKIRSFTGMGIPAPIVSYLYHEYIGMVGGVEIKNKDFTGFEDPDEFKLISAIVWAWGNKPQYPFVDGRKSAEYVFTKWKEGKLDSIWVKNLQYLASLVKMYRVGKNALFFGEMVRSPKISGFDKIKVRLGNNTQDVPALISSAFKRPDGTVYIPITNWTTREETIAMLDFSRCDWLPSSFDLWIVKENSKKLIGHYDVSSGKTIISVNVPVRGGETFFFGVGSYFQDNRIYRKVIENQHLLISASKVYVNENEKEAALILDKVSNETKGLSVNLIHSPLWQLELWDKKENKVILFPDFSEIKKYEGPVPGNKENLSIASLNNRLTLSWANLPVKDAKLNVTIEITLKENGSDWNIDAKLSGGKELSLLGVRFPVFVFDKFGESGKDDRLLFPQAGGVLISDPTHAHHNIKDDPLLENGKWSWFEYPGNIKHQFFAYYGGKADGNPLLYVAASDKHLNYKRLYYNAIDGKLITYATHYPAADPTNSREKITELNIRKNLDYGMTIDLFKGDWYDATQKYRSWMISEHPDFLPKKLFERKGEDLPETMEDFVLLPMFYLPYNLKSLDSAKAEKKVEDFKDYLSRHNVPFKALYVMATRPSDELPSSMNFSPDEMRDNLSDDVRNLPMMPGSQRFIDDIWNKYGILSIGNRDTGHWRSNDYDFIKTAGLVLRPDGSMVTCNKQPYFTSNSQWNCFNNRIKLTKELFEDSKRVNGAKRGIGYQGIMLSGQGVIPKLDFAPTFSFVNKKLDNHPVPGGNWWSKNWEKMTDILIKTFSNYHTFILTTERSNEFLISLPYTIPGALHSHFTFATSIICGTPPILPNSRYVPLSEAVYHDYGLQIPPRFSRTLFHDIYIKEGLSEKEAVAAASLHQASVAVLYGMPLVNMLAYESSNDGKHKPVKVEYDGSPDELKPWWKKEFEYEVDLSEARHKARKFLVYGKMLRPPEVAGEEKDIKLIRNGKIVTWHICPVLASAWRSPENETGIIITNPYPEEIKANIVLDRKEYNFARGKYVLNVIYSNFKSPKLTLDENSNIVNLTIPPYGVVVYSPLKICSDNDAESSFFGIGYAVSGYAKTISQTGARWVKIPSVAWGKIETVPPKNGKHFYRWNQLDKLVREYEDEGFHIQIVVKAACKWGAKDFAPPPESWRKSYPPKAEHLDDYSRFIRALVERYDGDGQEDMPYLKFPIRYYEIESEAQHKIFWEGTTGEYEKLLETAYEAAKQANPETKIILSGINFGSLFEENPSREELENRIEALPPEYKKEIDFVVKTLSFGNYYDVIDYHYNRDYYDVYGAVSWIGNVLKKCGYEKEIWAGDALSVPWITDGKHTGIVKALSDSSNPFHDKATEWLRAKQAELSVKKIVTAAETGIKKIFLESIKDFSPNAYKNANRESWVFAGFLNEDGTLRPVFYAYRQAVNKLSGFQKAERIEGLGKDVFLFRFTFSNKKPVYVVWCEQGKKQISLDVNCKYAEMEKVITEKDVTNSSPEIIRPKNGKVTFVVDSTPVFVTCH